MSESNKKLLLYVGLISLVSIIARVVPHIPNTAPIAALSLFAGFHLRSTWAFLVPLAVLFVTDYFIGFYNPGVLFSVYGSFLLIAFLGSILRTRTPNSFIIGGASIVGSTIFFIFTNFAVWLFSGMYLKSPEGLILCYVLAIPFFGYSLLGDLFWNGAFFHGYAFFKRTFSRPLFFFPTHIKSKTQAL